ncbi:MAG: BamA/TamA family outer membrane protein, partial [Bacteroidia bacterium]
KYSKATLALFWACLCSGFMLAQEPVFRAINFKGNTKTKAAVMLRTMTFGVGDTLERKGLSDVIATNRENLFNLGLFNEVDLDVEMLADGLAVNVVVKERWYIIPIPEIGLEERNAYDALRQGNLKRLVYGLAIDWRNLTGRNERLRVLGQLGFSQRLYLEYSYPAIFPKANIDFNLGLRYINEPEIITGTDSGRVQWNEANTEALRRTHRAEIGLAKNWGPRKQLRLRLDYTHLRFADSIYIYNPGFITNANSQERYPSLRLAYANDQRDYRAFPLKGYKYQIVFRQAGLGNIGTTTFSRIGATWAHHIPIGERWNIAFGTHHVFTFGKRVPWQEKNFMGIETNEFRGLGYNIRGYEPYAIAGDDVHISKVEGKFAVFPLQTVRFSEIPVEEFQTFPLGVYLSAFVDGGRIEDNSFNNRDRYLKDRWLLGYGLGLNIIGFYDNLLRVEYAWNHLGQGGFYFHGSVSIK